MGKLTRLAKWNIYFRRGWGTWIGFIIGVLTSAVIFYQYLFTMFPWLAQLFPSFIIFMGALFLVLFTFSTIIGFFDMKRGTYPVESTVAAMYAPYIRDQFKALHLFFEGKVEEAKRICERWTGE